MKKQTVPGEEVVPEGRNFIAKGAMHVAVAKATEPISVTFVLLPKFTMLAFSSAIEPLRMANQLTNQVLFRWEVLSEDGKPVPCSNGVPVVVDGPFASAKPEHWVREFIAEHTDIE